MTFAVQGCQLERDGRPFVAVGVNYHPAAAGCRLWTDTAPEVFRRDFAAIADAGLNTIRLFVYWRDFEPAPGQYEPTVFTRLRQAVAVAGEAGLTCVISLLTIWMNGQRLDLPWRGGRSLWLDASMLERQAEFVREICAALDGLDNVLAFDLGDEIANVDPAAATALPHAAVASWREHLARVLREYAPGTLVIQANDASAVLSSSPFGVDNAQAMDMIATHGFPTWAPGSIESTLCYKSTNLASFLARFGAAYGTPFVDEIGSYGTDESNAAAYLRAATASVLANGAAGVLAWCWQDIASTQEPFRERPNERFAGLCRLDGTAKPALAELRRVACQSGRLTASPGRGQVAIYVPECERASGSSYLDTGGGTLATFFAYLLLKRAHLDADIVSGDIGDYDLVCCPSVSHITLPDLERLGSYVAGGGTLFYSMGDHLHGFPGSDLAGGRIVDFSLLSDGKAAIHWDGDAWPLDWSGGGRPVTIAPTHGEPVAAFPDGTPAMLRTRFGRGHVLFCAAPFERLLDGPGRLTGGAWESFYRRIAMAAGCRPLVTCADPDIEIVPDRGPRPFRAVVINHGSTPVRTDIVFRAAASDPGTKVPVRLAAADWQIVEREPGANG
jgi:hypothetical protein